MSCCGQKREALARPERRQITPDMTPARPASPADFGPARPAGSTPPPAPVGFAATDRARGSIRLRYLARSPILVHGMNSGRAYRFSGETPVQRVAPADAPPLLASGHFRREA